MGIAGKCMLKHLHLIVEGRPLKRLEQAVKVPSLVTICVHRRVC